MSKRITISSSSSSHRDTGAYYITIGNNGFDFLQENPLISLNSLAEPVTLLQIFYEINQNHFEDLKKSISSSGSYGIIYKDLNDILNQAYLNMKPNNIRQIVVDTVKLINKDEKELEKVMHLVIIYFFLYGTGFNHKIIKLSVQGKSQINKIIDECVYKDEDLRVGEISDIMEVSTHNLNTELELQNKRLQFELEKLQKQINKLQDEYHDLKTNYERDKAIWQEKAVIWTDKIKHLEKRKIVFKDYHEIKGKGKNYDKGLNDYEQGREVCLKDKESTNDSVCFTSNGNGTEQDYGNIIIKKDYDLNLLRREIEQLGNQRNELLINNQRSIEVEELKQKYEMEFELIASAIYNIGLEMQKQEGGINLDESNSCSWGIKKRVEFINGDY